MKKDEKKKQILFQYASILIISAFVLLIIVAISENKWEHTKTYNEQEKIGLPV